MSRLVVAVSLLAALFMGFTILDSFSYMLTGQSIGEVFFGGGSPVADALLEVIPGMSPLEFLVVNFFALLIMCLVFVGCIYGVLPPKKETEERP